MCEFRHPPVDTYLYSQCRSIRRFLFFFYKRVTNIQKSRRIPLSFGSGSCELADKLTARCTKLIYRIFLLFFFLFGGYGHAFLIKGSGCDVIAKGGDGNESDLLHEIDKALRIGRGFLLGQGAFAILLNHWQHASHSFAKKVPFPNEYNETRTHLQQKILII